MRLRGLLLRNHLHGVLLFDDDHLTGGNRWHRSRGWHSNTGCGSVSSVVVLIISTLIHAVLSKLISELHDELIVRLDHSFQGGLLLLKLLGIFCVLLA
jgi:hypothetical protein